MEDPYSIEFFCDLFEIGDYNCTCQNYELREALTSFPEICEVLTEKSTVIYEPQYSRSLATIIVFIAFFGIIGNLIVMLVAIKNWRTSIPYQKLIGQLAASDFVFAILHFSTVIHLFWTNKWIYGEMLCKFLQSFSTLGSFVAVGLIFIISLERYLATLHPFFWKNGTKRINYTLAVLNVIISVASVTPRFMFLHVNDNEVCAEQWPSSSNRLAYELFMLVGYFCIPLAAIIYLNSRVMYALYHRTIQSVDRLLNEAKWRAKNRRIMRVFVSVIIAFTALVLPNRVIVLYFVLRDNDIEDDLYTALTFVAIVPYTLHVAINPFLYCVIDKTWRKKALTLVKCRLTTQRDKLPSSSVTNVNYTKNGSLLNTNAIEYYKEIPRVILNHRKPTVTSLVPDPDRETIL